MKKSFLFLLFAFSPILLWADPVEIDGIYYNLIAKAKEAEVTYGNWNVNVEEGGYIGDIVIPEKVEYEGVAYTVTSIGKSAFSLCRKLSSAKLPKSIRKIDDSAFSLCSSLQNITIPEGVETIGMTSFQFTAIKSMVIPDGVVSIGYMAFCDCKELTDISLPNSLTKLDVSVFQNCEKLQSITFPNGLISTGRSVCMGCKSLKKIIFSSSISSIDESAFCDCTSLEQIVIPNNVTRINTSAFEGCTDLKDITLGWGIEYIDSKAFAGCKNITNIYCYTDGVPSTSGSAFHDSYTDYSTLYVRESSINKFKTTAPWSQFKEYVMLEIPKHSLKYIIDDEIYKTYEIEEGAFIITEPEPQKKGFQFSGWSYYPVRMLYDDITITGSFSEVKKCAIPTIKYDQGTLCIVSDTEDAKFVTVITDDDIKEYSDASIKLTVTYNISVYATKAGFENSDVVNATLCWIDAEPKTEGITNGVANVSARAVLIQNNGGIITINGVEDGMRVSAYSLNGVEEAATISRNGAAVLNTNAQTGSTVIVKMGEKSVKVLMK